MSNELEIAAGAAAGGFFRPASAQHAAPPGTPCANCATLLQGPWCHACGQSAEDFHRSISRLIGEVVEGLLHMDGRIWRTLPGLMLRPGKLTRAYLDGHRAPQIPPLRLFLVVLLGVFLIGGLTNQSNKLNQPAGQAVADGRLSPEQRAVVGRHLDQANVEIAGQRYPMASNWLRTRLASVLADPKRFELLIEQWSERFAFLMLPVAALLMSLLFVFQRRFFLFDHAIFSLHSLSAAGIVVMAVMVLSALIGDSASILLLVLPLHLFGHMRGVYRSSAIGTLVRMILLFLGSGVAATLLIVGLLAVGLSGMGE